ncbi:MAG: hypothetical protein DRJ42_19235, partial [Deltaproteobacteria bacterium]
LARAEAGTGKARVLTYGASHAACDHVPGRLRMALQARFGDGGRGFTLPAWPSDRYPYWTWGATVAEGSGWARVRLNIERGTPDHYGIAGIVFDSEGREARAEISMPEEGVGAEADEVTVLYEAMPRGGLLEVSIDGTVVETIDTSARRVAAGYAYYALSEGAHVITLRAVPGAPVRVYGLSFARGQSGVVVDNVAISGARARYHLEWREPVYSAHLAAFAPDLLLLWYGGNESNDLTQPPAATRREMGAALQKLRRRVPEASCVIVGPLDKPLEIDGEWTHRERTDDVIRIVRALAFDNGCAYFDSAAFMGGSLSMVEWVNADPPLARGDHVHLSTHGYRLLAEELTKDLLAGYAPPALPLTSPFDAEESAPVEPHP